MTLEEEIKHAVELLKQGKIILYPTDTIWGIGCNAKNTKAVQRIYKIKERDDSKSMIVLISSAEQLKMYIKHVPPIAYDLIKNSASPLTIVYSGAKNMSKKLIAKDGTIAIRVVKGRFTSGVIEQLGGPLVSSSANISGQPTAATFEQIGDDIKNKVDYVVEHFRERTRNIRPSTIIRLMEDGKFSVLRS
jgi:L-threonylcarbamoyladenylate synthase